jgi:hypothetical protein
VAGFKHVGRLESKRHKRRLGEGRRRQLFP